MAINAIGSATCNRAALDVAPERTPVSRADLRNAIARAHHELTGRAASAGLLDTLTAHASLETGSGGQMYNFNFGGIKGRGPTGATARCRTKEVEGGREVEVRDGFRAYRSLYEGALDYVRLMRDRFGGAVSFAERGNVDGFAHALKQAHYYTADESKYAAALHSLSGAPREGVVGTRAGARSPANGEALTRPDSFELGRVIDAIARHPNIVEDPDDDA